MSAGCTVCQHPRVAEIDVDLMVPTNGYAKLGRVWTLDREALARHKRNGHVVPPNLAVPPAGSGDPVEEERKTAVEVLEDLLSNLRAVDTRGYSPRERNVHGEQVRRTAESLAKYQQAVDREGPAQRELRALNEMHVALLDALEDFPEAKAAVAQATHEWKRRRAAAPEEAA